MGKYQDSFFMEELKNGYFMLWDVCSQCCNTFTARIKDDNKTYAEVVKSETSGELQILSHESATYEGGSDLRIEIVFDNQEVDIKTFKTAEAILDEQSKTVGFMYTYCIEDGDDNDYNDAFISIIGWKNRG